MRTAQVLAVFLLLWMLACSGGGRRSMDAGEIQLFYFPFYLETFHPITIEDIETRARCRLLISAVGEEARLLAEILAGADHGTFGDRVVRLKIVGLAGGDVFVDRDGGILHAADDSEARLAKTKFGRLEQLVEKVGVAQGCEVR